MGESNIKSYRFLTVTFADSEVWMSDRKGFGRNQILPFVLTPDMEKEMATHSSILSWRIPWTEEPGGLQSMGSQRVKHN